MRKATVTLATADGPYDVEVEVPDVVPAGAGNGVVCLHRPLAEDPKDRRDLWLVSIDGFGMPGGFESRATAEAFADLVATAYWENWLLVQMQVEFEEVLAGAPNPLENIQALIPDLLTFRDIIDHWVDHSSALAGLRDPLPEWARV